MKLEELVFIVWLSIVDTFGSKRCADILKNSFAIIRS